MSIAYYATHISPNIVETSEGYRIALNVPICRTGYQDYLGSELQQHPDYDDDWAIEPNDVVKVYRSLAEVTAPKTVASFEGKSVLDGHPSGGIITADNEQWLSRGHLQNVRVGRDALPDGETPLLADLHLKNEGLIDKVDNGIRDVSCGYTYRLRMVDGRLEQYEIRGNHVAVVDQGRAGAACAIQDSSPADLSSPLRFFAGCTWRVGMERYQAALRGRPA